MRREYSPYSPPPEPEAQGKKPLPWSHMIISGAVGIVIGVATMVGVSTAIGSNETEAAPVTTTVQVPADTGKQAAMEYLGEKGVPNSNDLMDKFETVVCTALDSGNTGRQVIRGLTRYIPSMSNDEAAEIVAATAAYMCPEHIGQLPR